MIVAHLLLELLIKNKIRPVSKNPPVYYLPLLFWTLLLVTSFVACVTSFWDLCEEISRVRSLFRDVTGGVSLVCDVMT